MLKNFKIFFALTFFYSTLIHGSEILIQSTTSTRDSGFYEFLLPKYPSYQNINIKVVAVGTGQAIKNAENCDADLLIVHDYQKEINFMKNNFGIRRDDLMYNDYVLIGPSTDPAEINDSSSIISSFGKIARSKHKFISRSDSSGTYSFEMSIWDKVKINPADDSGGWYLETGQGMGPSLNIAVATGSYILSDRSTWVTFKNKQDHIILYENPVELANNYGIILVNPEHCPTANYESSLSLYNWLISDAVKIIINSFTVNDQQIFYTR
tara:strand:- start:148 stop:948 length:801 start_codon:yes stop_codon:yes gene_type:complete